MKQKEMDVQKEPDPQLMAHTVRAIGLVLCVQMVILASTIMEVIDSMLR
jgi:hypothetical protein